LNKRPEETDTSHYPVNTGVGTGHPQGRLRKVTHKLQYIN